MRRLLYPVLVIALVLGLCACGMENPVGVASTVPTTAATVPTTEVTKPTEPEHSPFYLPGYTVEQVIEYFEEVVLTMEYSDGEGDVSLVQKWFHPLHYRITGDATQEDLAILMALFDQLNQIPGFPGISPAAFDEQENLMIGFWDPENFDLFFSEVTQGEPADGATQFWFYTDTNVIHTASIGYRTDIDQITRSSVLLEEIVNTLGISDTELRTDSIVYQYSNDNLALSDMDWLILKLLYDPAIQCGMNAEDCRAVIRQLYY